MREIKFRAWDTVNKNMEEIDGSNLYIADGKVFEIYERSRNYEFYMYKREVSDRYTLMQYTGLNDNKGKETYEGDIVNVSHSMVENIPSYKAKIEWDKYRFALINLEFERFKWNTLVYPMGNLDPFGVDLEVLGNIYENPDLLEVEHG